MTEATLKLLTLTILLLFLGFANIWLIKRYCTLRDKVESQITRCLKKANGRYTDCSWYGRPASDWSVKHNAGECGHRKLMIVYNAESVPEPLTDELVIFNKGQMKVGPDFGCIHFK